MQALLRDPKIQEMVRRIKAERAAKPDKIRMKEDMDAALEKTRKEYEARWG